MFAALMAKPFVDKVLSVFERTDPVTKRTLHKVTIAQCHRGSGRVFFCAPQLIVCLRVIIEHVRNTFDFTTLSTASRLRLCASGVGDAHGGHRLPHVRHRKAAARELERSAARREEEGQGQEIMVARRVRATRAAINALVNHPLLPLLSFAKVKRGVNLSLSSLLLKKQQTACFCSWSRCARKL